MGGFCKLQKLIKLLFQKKQQQQKSKNQQTNKQTNERTNEQTNKQKVIFCDKKEMQVSYSARIRHPV